MRRQAIRILAMVMSSSHFPILNLDGNADGELNSSVSFPVCLIFSSGEYSFLLLPPSASSVLWYQSSLPESDSSSLLTSGWNHALVTFKIICDTGRKEVYWGPERNRRPVLELPSLYTRRRLKPAEQTTSSCCPARRIWRERWHQAGTGKQDVS